MTDRPNSLAARDIAYYFHPATNARRHEQVGPMMIERGEGVRVWDDQGKEYIEGLAGLWSVAVGFGEPRLVKAAAEQMAKLPFYHSFSHKSHPSAVKLAERLVALAPGMAKAHFTSSGSEANDLVDQDDLVLQQRARPPRQEEDPVAAEGLSRRHHRLGEPDGHAELPPRLRSAAAVRAPPRPARTSGASARRARARRRSSTVSRRSWRRRSWPRGRRRSPPSSASR